MQRQIKVGSAGDAAEHEANRVAEQVSSGPSSAKPTISRLETMQRAEAHATQPDATAQRSPCGECQAGQHEQQQPAQRPSGTASVYCKPHDQTPSSADNELNHSVRRKGDTGGQPTGNMDAAAAHAVATKDAGSPLRPHVLQKLESRMGADLSGVRVHEGPAAQESAAALQARAFTHKGDIWLGKGESQENTNLMAHEATHVVQQGAAVMRSANGGRRQDDVQTTGAPVVRRGIWDSITGAAGAAWDATGGRLVDAAGHIIHASAALFWRLVKRVVPAPIIELIEDIHDAGGVFAYLKEKVGGIFGSIFGGLRNLGAFIPNLIQTFGKLASSAHDIIGALGRGDCKPLFDALSRLGDVLSQMAGAAWDKIKEFFAPIGAFFKNLWTKFALPALEFLGDFAKGVLNKIKDIGQRIWDFTQPVRDAASAAWNWLKRHLGIDGGGEDGEGGNGIVHWVMGKLGDAWNWVKDQLEPIIGPMKAFYEKVISILPLDAILNLRQTVHEWLHHISQMATAMRNPKGVTQNQEALRGQILPAVKAAIVRLRSRIVSAGSWISEQIDGIAETVNGFFAGLRNNRILKLFSGAIQWVQDKVTSLSTWVQSGVMGLFNTIGAGVGKLADFVEPVLNALRKIVSVVANLVKEFPGLVLGPIWHAIPACIRDPIKDFIIQKILAQIPVISTFLKIPEIWGKIKQLVMGLLSDVFVNGDLAGAALRVFRFVVEAAGINYDLLLSVFAKAASSLDDIIMHPVKFLSNLAGAVGQGLKQFVLRLPVHLATGLVNWLVKPLKDLGVEPIKDLSLTSILTLVMSVLGVTEAKLRAKAEKAVGPKATKVLESAWTWIKTLLTKGLGGIWEEIKDQLSNLYNMVIGGITKWITTEIVEAGVAKLIKLCNPVGAVIEAIQTIYKTISFLVEKANEILELVDSVLDSIGKIVAGDIPSAAAWIENSLARAVPTVIAFLAKWLGFSDPGPKVHEIVKGIQDKVDGALDWLVDKAVAIGQKIAGVAKSVAGKIASLIFPKRDFKSNDEDHAVEAVEHGDDYDIVIRSDPLTMDKFLVLAAQEAPKKAGQLQNAYSAYQAVKVDSRKAAETPEREAELDLKGKSKVEKYNKVADLIAEIYPMIPSLAGGGFETKIIYGKTDDRGGSMMVAHPLAGDNVGKGSDPSQSSDFPAIWPSITQKRPGSDTRLYVKGHLLNNRLGGSGTLLENITPLTYSANGTHASHVESELKDIVTKKSKRMVHYEVHVNYPSSRKTVPANVNPEEGRLATSISTSWYELVPIDKKLVAQGSPRTETITNVPPYPHA